MNGAREAGGGKFPRGRMSGGREAEPRSGGAEAALGTGDTNIILQAGGEAFLTLKCDAFTCLKGHV